MANPRVDPTDETVLLRVKIPKRLEARLREDAAAAGTSLSELVRSRLTPAKVPLHMGSAGNLNPTAANVVATDVRKAAEKITGLRLTSRPATAADSGGPGARQVEPNFKKGR